MARINLLPWREQVHTARRKRFLVVLVSMLGVVAGSLYFSGHYIERAIERQSVRNHFFQGALVELDSRVMEIDQLKVRREQLIERLQAIEILQASRSVSGLVFDQLARSLPEGTYFKGVKMTERTIAIVGVAQSNNRIAELMRNLEVSHWLEAPELVEIKTNEQPDNNYSRYFQMTVRHAPGAYEGIQP